MATAPGRSGGFLGAFLVASLASGYVMYGFDTASSLGEETLEPRRTAPRAILRAILASFVIGGAILVFAIMSAPDLSDPKIGSSSGGLQYIVEQVMWGPLGKIFLVCIVVAVTVCSLAVHTAAIRLTFAMARDNALPFGERLARVNPNTQTPIVPAVVIGVIAALILVHQHRPAEDLHGADLDRGHHDLPGVPDGDRADAAGSACRGSGRRRTSRPGAISPWAGGECSSTSSPCCGARHGAQPGVAARGRLRRALVQHLGRVRVHRL